METIKFRYIFKHISSGNIEVKYYYLNQLEERTTKELSPCFSSDYELLSRDQYTGLKDRSGKEIYEGDVVSSFIPNRESTGAIIDYDDEITVFYDIRNANEQFIFLLEPSVIGNINENPDLIKA